MGDWYDFEFRLVDGINVAGFSYSTEETGHNEIFVEFTEEQKKEATLWAAELDALEARKESMINSWIGSK